MPVLLIDPTPDGLTLQVTPVQRPYDAARRGKIELRLVALCSTHPNTLLKTS